MAKQIHEVAKARVDPARKGDLDPEELKHHEA
jgi:hypothetical protein